LLFGKRRSPVFQQARKRINQLFNIRERQQLADGATYRSSIAYSFGASKALCYTTMTPVNSTVVKPSNIPLNISYIGCFSLTTKQKP
jgi:hypothetical protein